MLQDEKQLSAAGGIWSYWEKAQWRLPWPSPSPPPASALRSIQKQGFSSLSLSSPLSLFAFPPVRACLVYHPSRTWVEYLLNKYRLCKPHSSLCVLFSLTFPTCFSRILPWLTVLTATTARSPCTAASTSNRTTAHTASHVTTACSQTLVMSVKSWSAMTQGWEAFWHDQTCSQRSWNIIKCVPVEYKRVFSVRQSFIWPINVCCNDV